MAPAGRTLLVLGLLVAVYGIGASLYGARSQRQEWVASGRRSVYALAGVMTVCLFLIGAVLLALWTTPSGPALFRVALVVLRVLLSAVILVVMVSVLLRFTVPEHLDRARGAARRTGRRGRGGPRRRCAHRGPGAAGRRRLPGAVVVRPGDRRGAASMRAAPRPRGRRGSGGTTARVRGATGRLRRRCADLVDAHAGDPHLG